MSKLKTDVLAHCDRLLECRTWFDFKPLRCEGVTGLCDNYYRDGSCAGCPVSAATGRAKCGGTPWWSMLAAIEMLYPWESVSEPLPEAVAMRDFLEGLDWSGQP